MVETGSRPGADFSDVRFHSDTVSMNRSRATGTRAQGSDIHKLSSDYGQQIFPCRGLRSVIRTIFLCSCLRTIS